MPTWHSIKWYLSFFITAVINVVLQCRLISLQQENHRLRVDLRERERLLEVERKAVARDTLLANRLEELKNRVDALACANYGLRERLRSQIMMH